MKTAKLTKEEWRDVGERMGVITQILGGILKKTNLDGRGESDVQEMEADMMAAYSAVMYVSEFAADKCLFAVVEAGKGENHG